MQRSYYEVRDPQNRLRFSALAEAEAIAFAQGLWRRAKVVCSVTEVPR